MEGLEALLKSNVSQKHGAIIKAQAFGRLRFDAQRPGG